MAVEVPEVIAGLVYRVLTEAAGQEQSDVSP
jgi:hypothetical protein